MSEQDRFVSWEEAVRWLRNQPSYSGLVMASYYDDPLEAAAERYRRSEEWQAIRTLLPQMHGQALDVGAGRGIASYALACEGFHVTALEPDNSALVGAEAIRQLAALSQLPIQVAQEFSERLPFPDASFDLVFARAVLHHTGDLEASCREFYRVLKPGGLFLAIREHVISRPADLPRFLELHPLHRLYGGEHAFLLKDYVAALKRAGFAKPDVVSPWRSPINFAPYTLETLKDELAQRAARRLPGLVRVTRRLLDMPGVWPLLRAILERVDHRPGRLYSFVAIRT